MLYCGAYAKKADGSEDDFLYIGYNFGNGVCELALPKLPEKKKWYQVMNTARGNRFITEAEAGAYHSVFEILFSS